MSNSLKKKTIVTNSKYCYRNYNIKEYLHPEITNKFKKMTYLMN